MSDILDKVVQRADMDIKPIQQPKEIHQSIPIEAVNNVIPKPLTGHSHEAGE